jgi:hypothetical protein
MAGLKSIALVAGLSAAAAYPNGAPNARLPTMGWSSWIALGPNGSAPVFDFCDEQSVMAAADAFMALGFYEAGYRHLHLDEQVHKTNNTHPTPTHSLPLITSGALVNVSRPSTVVGRRRSATPTARPHLKPITSRTA